MHLHLMYDNGTHTELIKSRLLTWLVRFLKSLDFDLIKKFFFCKKGKSSNEFSGFEQVKREYQTHTD